MFPRLCALALAAAPIHHVAQLNEIRPEPQGLWSQAIRERALLIEGAADEARELGARALAELPTGAQSALRLMRLRQHDVRARVRDAFKDLGLEADFESRAKALSDSLRTDTFRAPGPADRRLAEADVDLEERAALELDRSLTAARRQVDRVRTDVAAREASRWCGLGQVLCGFVTVSARHQRDVSEGVLRELERQSEEVTKRLAEARARRDQVRREVSATAERFGKDARAMEGFYRTTPSAGCARRLAFHQGPGVGLRESPFLTGSISEEDIVRDRARLFACVDERRALVGVEVTDDQGRRLAKSEITRDRAGTVTRVRIFDRAATLLEDHRYASTAPEYEVTYRGARGGRVRALTK